MVTEIGAKEEEKRGVSREKATSDFVTSTLKQYRVILPVILANERPDCSNTRNVPSNHISNIGEKNSEVLRRIIKLKGIIKYHWARSRHHTFIHPRNDETVARDKNRVRQNSRDPNSVINRALTKNKTRTELEEVVRKKKYENAANKLEVKQ